MSVKEGWKLGLAHPQGKTQDKYDLPDLRKIHSSTLVRQLMDEYLHKKALIAKFVSSSTTF